MKTSNGCDGVCKTISEMLKNSLPENVIYNCDNCDKEIPTKRIHNVPNEVVFVCPDGPSHCEEKENELLIVGKKCTLEVVITWSPDGVYRNFHKKGSDTFCCWHDNGAEVGFDTVNMMNAVAQLWVIDGASKEQTNGFHNLQCKQC